jgi:PAS domain S-box-containing protein
MDTDITNRKLAEEVLRQGSDELEARVEERTLRLYESEERFRDFVEIGSDWLWEMDADFRYSYFSASYAPHSGISTEDAVGRTRAELYLDILPRLSADEIKQWEKFNQLVKAHQTFRGCETKWVGSNGEIQYFTTSGKPIFDTDGKFKGYRGVGTNITKRRLAEDALLEAHDKLEQVVDQRTSELLTAKETAEAANQAKSEFLSAMSHELRTPMNSILGFGEILNTDSIESLSDRQKSFVDHILSSGKHLMELINQVLELNRIEVGKLSINFEGIPANKIIDESLQLVRIQAHEKDVEILNQNAGEQLPIVWTDGTRLTQVLLNLLSNAIKYNHNEGTVTVSCQETPGQMLRISIADTGIGIPEDKQQYLFTPFERLGREGGEIEGTGIGLTITKQLIELLGGKVGYQSKEDNGSIFWIDVPMSREQITALKKSEVLG